jgi:hypothetical protein
LGAASDKKRVKHRGGGGKKQRVKGAKGRTDARINSLGFTPVVEERTRVKGPDRAKAADIYGADVVRPGSSFLSSVRNFT